MGTLYKISTISCWQGGSVAEPMCWVGGLQNLCFGWDMIRIMLLCGAILQDRTCKILSQAENPRWSQVWQYTQKLACRSSSTILDYLGLSEAIWDFLGQSGTIWDYLGLGCKQKQERANYCYQKLFHYYSQLRSNPMNRSCLSVCMYVFTIPFALVSHLDSTLVGF